MPSATSEQGGHGSPERLKRDAALAVATGFAIQSALVVTGPLLARMLGPSRPMTDAELFGYEVDRYVF